MSFTDRLDGILSPEYAKHLLFMISMGLLIACALNCFFMAVFDVCPFEVLFGKSITNVLYILVGIAALSIMFFRDSYLPFLGPMVAPCSVLQPREPPGATKAVKVIVPANSKVIYWAAEPASESLKTVHSAAEAYQKYDNAGVAVANADGVAILKVREPQSYKVPFMGKLESHIHYRICGESGFMGRVNTAHINHEGPEGFEYNAMDPNNLADSAASL
jgi:uncharacterized membrane protein YuzA (DUF378 family)/intracellular sulfur oxidation DsrE/DsrF family protein